MFKECHQEADWQEAVKASYDKPVLVFKHSTRCPISASRWPVVRAFADKEPGVECFQLKVIEDRSLSLLVAQATGIQHESPQVILLHKGEAVWHTSHWSITEEEIRAALSRIH